MCFVPKDSVHGAARRGEGLAPPPTDMESKEGPYKHHCPYKSGSLGGSMLVLGAGGLANYEAGRLCSKPWYAQNCRPNVASSGLSRTLRLVEIEYHGKSLDILEIYGGNMYPYIPLYIFITYPHIHLYTTRQMNLQHFFWLRAAASSKPTSLAVGDLGFLT